VEVELYQTPHFLYGVASRVLARTKIPTMLAGFFCNCLYKNFFMDNKQYTGVQDDIHVDVNDPDEVEYVHQQHPGYTHDEIIDVIIRYGPMRSDIEAHLEK
jgi:hypothetical protein